MAILNEDVGGTQELVTSFLMSLSPGEEDPAAAEKNDSGAGAEQSLSGPSEIERLGTG